MRNVENMHFIRLNITEKRNVCNITGNTRCYVEKNVQNY